MYPYATTYFKYLSIFHSLPRPPQISPGERKLWGNRVVTCHCKITKQINGYLMTKVYDLQIVDEPY